MAMPRLPWDHEKVIERFWGRVRRCPGCACFLFEGSTSRGWGILRAADFPGCKSGIVKAHRYAYALEHGPPDPEEDIHHDHDKCNHRNCVNVAHLGSIDHDEHGAVSQEHRTQKADLWPEDDFLPPIF